MTGWNGASNTVYLASMVGNRRADKGGKRDRSIKQDIGNIKYKCNLEIYAGRRRGSERMVQESKEGMRSPRGLVDHTERSAVRLATHGGSFFFPCWILCTLFCLLLWITLPYVCFCQLPLISTSMTFRSVYHVIVNIRIVIFNVTSHSVELNLWMI